MSEAELVDLGVDPAEQRRAARRRLTRVIAPIVAASLLFLSVIGLLVASHESNRRGALALSDDVLAGLEKRIEVQVAQWLDPAARALKLLHAVYGEGAIAEATTRQTAENLAMHLLANVPSIALVSLAAPNGNYVLQRRNERGGIDTKVIDNAPGPRSVTWIRRDGDNNEIAREDDPTDTFDPRTRPWYTGAVERPGVAWTDPYVFFTDRTPGITASVAFRKAGELRGVFGVDIRLDALSAFLRTLSIGHSGRAMIVDRDGRVVAYPDAGRAVIEQGGEIIRSRLDALNDPVLLRAYSLMRVNGHQRFTFAIDGTSHIAIWARMNEAGDGSWSLLITAPEEEFVGFVGSTSRLTAVVGAIVVIVALGLAVLLIRQGLRADSMERMLERRTRTMTAQVQTLSQLARAPSVYDPSRDEGLALLTGALSDTLQARRASLWQVAGNGGSLRCDDIYDTAAGVHGAGQRLRRDEHPRFFAAIMRGDPFEVANAAADPRTTELAVSLLAEAGTQQVLVVPMMRGHGLVGVLLVEDRATALVPQGQATGFALAIAGIAASRLTTSEARPSAARAEPSLVRQAAGGGGGGPAVPLPPPPAAQARGNGALAPERISEVAARAAASRLDQRGLAAEVFPAVTVMVLRLSDALALAEPVAQAGGCALVDQVVRIVEDAATACSIAYVRVMGDSVVVADGFGNRADGAAEAIVGLGLDVAERCAQLFSSLDHALLFRIGIDTGPVIGSTVGTGARTYNIWGEAVRAAEAMAASAPPGSVQLTEAVHARIGERFMFRPRGRFWVPGAGEMATFLLAGRA
ncbi:cache domain-containing protein [Elioraea sp.]|uniref:cache domain-containing protein n=1 Tax=Elioraea sp. TaxID=2185103 RepID=UPI0025C38B58|nr:cache domain-containing protein [Elioraea sp.]